LPQSTIKSRLLAIAKLLSAHQLAMSFDFTADAGAAITFSGSYTGSSFIDVNIFGDPVLSVAEVPIPAAAWLVGSAIWMGMYSYIPHRLLCMT
jgi:hypothetical protein